VRVGGGVGPRAAVIACAPVIVMVTVPLTLVRLQKGSKNI